MQARKYAAYSFESSAYCKVHSLLYGTFYFAFLRLLMMMQHTQKKTIIHLRNYTLNIRYYLNPSNR